MTVAFCFASGLISFADRLPRHVLPIASGPHDALRDFLSGCARHGYDAEKDGDRLAKIPGTDTLLVPGVPEAPNPFEALTAFEKWLDRLKRNAPAGVTVF